MGLGKAVPHSPPTVGETFAIKGLQVVAGVARSLQTRGSAGGTRRQ